MDIPRGKRARGAGRRVAALAAFAALALGVFGFLEFEPAAPAVDARTLLVDEAERGTFVMEVRGPGTLVPEQIRWITALTAGRVEQRLLDPGEPVEPDTVILQLSNPDVELEALDAERQRTAARGELLALRTGLEEQRLNQLTVVASAKAAFLAARADAQASDGLVAKKIVSALDAGKKKDRAEEMDARYRAEKLRLELLVATADEKLALQEEQVERLQQIAEFQQKRVESMTVRAGAPGVLQDTTLEVGQWVQPGETLAKVAEPRGLKAVLKIPETLARDVAAGQDAKIDTRNGVVSGRVIRIDPSVQNGAVEVHVRLEGELPRGARSDLSVDGTIEVARAEGVLHIDRPAYSQADTTLGLFVLNEAGDGAVRASVRLGRVSANSAEVLGGLEPGDRAVVSDMSRWSTFDRIRFD
jgi:multidrug resistance efflux pump